ncbi:hypothetical protein Vretimale_7071 [Volvox reticuliferus]|nr:hypothetical protein Vretifemale_10959 [Volvox reticuliferus]GIM02157.1 hypothetical protein Vretimale_7071 [Volvox reticuliferus]
MRAWVNPPTLEVPEGGAVPEWYAEEWVQRTRWRRIGNQVALDTAALAAVMLLMDGVEDGMRRLRGGAEDPWNRVMGGVTAGGLLGLLWYPSNPRGRAYMTAAGSFVGYFSYVTDKAVDSSLLKTQMELERELLEKPDDQLRSALSRPYLQSLLRAKQRQLNDAARKAVAERVQEEQQGLARPMLPSGGMIDMLRSDAGSGDNSADSMGPYSSSGEGSYGSGAQSFNGGSSSSGGKAAAPAGNASRNNSSHGRRISSGSSSTPNDRGVLVITEEEDDGASGGGTAGDEEIPTRR